MDPREQADDPESGLRLLIEGFQAGLQTAMPVIIQSFDRDAMTVVAQPAVQATKTDRAGVTTAVNLPLLLDCPVEFPSGGGVTITFPIKAGDEGVAVFSSRCFDAWAQSGGVQPQATGRMHDLSDAIVRVGVRSKPRVLTNVSTTATQIRSDDASTLIELNPAAQTITLTAPGGLTINADITHTGKLTSSGIIKSLSDVVAKTISLFSHLTTGVQPGSGVSGGPQ